MDDVNEDGSSSGSCCLKGQSDDDSDGCVNLYNRLRDDELVIILCVMCCVLCFCLFVILFEQFGKFRRSVTNTMQGMYFVFKRLGMLSSWTLAGHRVV